MLDSFHSLEAEHQHSCMSPGNGLIPDSLKREASLDASRVSLLEESLTPHQFFWEQTGLGPDLRLPMAPMPGHPGTEGWG